MPPLLIESTYKCPWNPLKLIEIGPLGMVIMTLLEYSRLSIPEMREFLYLTYGLKGVQFDKDKFHEHGPAVTQESRILKVCTCIVNY